MDAGCDPAVREVWWMKSAQVGATEALNNTIGYHVHQDPAPMLLVQPTLEIAEAWSKDRLAPMIRDTPVLAALIADPKSRDSGNTLLHKKFRGGHLTVAGANASASLASRPIRVVLLDEVDRYPASAGTEGDPVSLARKRTTTFWNRKVLAVSTPTVKGSSRIEQGFDTSDQRYYFVPCPHCDEFQRLRWQQVRWPENEPERAQYACEHCGALIDDGDKGGMLARGEWRAAKPFRGIAGFHISELYSPWSTWAEMAVAFLQAKRFPETLQTWINTALGETWEEKGESVEPGSLMDRRESYTAATLPAGVLLLTAGVDVQDDRLEAFVWGWGAQEEAWLADRKVLRGDPGGQQLWGELDAYLQGLWQIEDGRQLLIEAAAVDSGGHYTQQVYRYAAKRKARRVWAIKGMAGAGRLAWPKSKPQRGGSTRANVFMVGVDTIKGLIYGRLRSSKPGPGYLHFPLDCDEEFFAQLTSEVLLHKVIQGRRVAFWKPRTSGVRQEALDGTVYAYAALVGRGLDVLAQRAAHPWSAPTPATAEARVALPAQSASVVQPVTQHRPSYFGASRKGWFRR